MNNKKLVRKGSFGKFLITFTLTIVAVILISFALDYFRGG
jgi:hypothetical protein